MPFSFTPQMFYDVFVLSFSWEPDPHRNDLRWSWTTVDKVGTILHRLDVLSAKQKKAISKDRRTQSLFIMKSAFWGKGHSSSWLLEVVPKNLVIVCEASQDLDRVRMLRDMRIFITPAGRAYAAKIESRYANMVTKEAYLAELAKRAAEFKTQAAHAAAAGAYRRRLEQELTEDA